MLLRSILLFCCLFLFSITVDSSSSLGIPISRFDGSFLIDKAEPVPLQPDPIEPKTLLTRLLGERFLWNAVRSGTKDLENTKIRDQIADRAREPHIPGTRVDELFCKAYMANYSDDARKLAEISLITTGAAKYYIDLLNGRSDLRDTIANVDTTKEIDCPKQRRYVNCLGLRYRAIDGVCNNVVEPWWGATYEPFSYDLKPSYDDFVQKPRDHADDGSALPAGDHVSGIVHSTSEERFVETGVSRMFLTWGFFNYIDMTQFFQWRTGTFQCLDCCNPVNKKHPECAIWVNENCGTPRTLPGLSADCKMVHRAPANMVTSYLDASPIYGSTSVHAHRLRSFELGQLKTGNFGEDTERLDTVPPPFHPFDADNCRTGNDHLPCFDFGSYQMNILVDVSAFGTVFLREHNRIAQELYWFNRHWDDQRLYEEARRIVVAKIQHITYNEYLPLLLGKQRMAKYGLQLQNAGLFSGYDRELNAQTEIAVPSAAFYFLSMIPAQMGMNDTFTFTNEAIYNPSWVYFPGYMEGIIQFLVTNPVDRVDRFITDQLRIVSPFAPNFPIDIVGALIQGGREVGLAPYVRWREACGLSKVETFNDLASEIDPDAITALSTAYGSVNDIDLFAGGLSERRITGSVIGPTFMCILVSHYQKIKRGDRHWYENYLYPSSFTEAQLLEIRKTTLSRILCDNTKIDRIQPKAMEPADVYENCPVACYGSIIPFSYLYVFADVEPKVRLPVSLDTIRLALDLGRKLAEEQSQRTRDSVRSQQSEKLLASSLQFLVSRPDGDAVVRAGVSEALIHTTRLLLTQEDIFEDRTPLALDQNVLQSLLPSVDVSLILAQLPESKCLVRTWPCDHSARYRTISGWCNNLDFPSYGTSHSTFRRLLAPEYDDGFNSPRTTALSGNPLPNPRLVSIYVHRLINRDHPKFTHWVMQWGQFMDHDVTLTPISADPDGKALDCSDCDSAETVSINCFPIPIPKNDPFFPSTTPNGRPKCFPFARSLLGQLHLGFRQQINEITSFVDASNVYGADDCKADSLRVFKHGLLKSQQGDGGEVLLPVEENTREECRAQVHACFAAGDVRVNEQIGLASLHTVWMREHNRLALRLSELNPHWTDEIIYQETRRIVIALHQHITYNEFLPKVVGWKTMDEFNLLPERFGATYYTKYDSLCDPTVSNAFATAAFRFGHSLVQSRLRVESGNTNNVVSLSDVFFNPDVLYGSNFITRLLDGMGKQPANQYDPMLTEALGQHLFEDKNIPFSGLDLAALNIQRGRDHGLAPYVKYRKRFKLDVPEDFDGLVGIMTNESIDAMKKVYESVADIDLFTGLMSEIPIAGSLVGPLTGKILGLQFQRLRQCDRFWYENAYDFGSFSEPQLVEIRKMSLAKVVCRHLPGVTKIQPYIFSLPDRYQNDPMKCESLLDIDLNAWKYEVDCKVANQTIPRGKAARVSPCISCTCTIEGPVCHSFRVNNCLNLAQTYDKESILSDDACVVQCHAFVSLGL